MNRDARLRHDARGDAPVRPGRPMHEEGMAHEHVARPSGRERRSSLERLRRKLLRQGHERHALLPRRREERRHVEMRADLQLGRGVVGAYVGEEEQAQQPAVPCSRR